MSEIEIRDIDGLLKPYLQPDSFVKDYKIKRLTAPGENYGSLLTAVEVLVKNPKGKEILKLVSKQLPENEFLQRMFKVSETFPKELEFYKTVVPTLVKFQKEYGMKEVIDFVPAFYGGRRNLINDPELVDKDAVILLENLRYDGFGLGDRMTGFDLDTTKLILKHLARFHAVPIAFKLKQPEVFQNTILPNIRFVKIFDEAGPEVAEAMLGNYISIVKESEELSHLADRLKEVAAKNIDSLESKPKEPFATITHNDLWVNNMLLKRDSDGIVKACKFIDFQIISYASPGKDIVFFLYSSVQTDVIENYFDDLIKLYYDEFIGVLKTLKCDVHDFSMEALREEMKYSIEEFELFHCLLMVKPVLAPANKVIDMNDMTENDLSDNELTPQQKQKTLFIIKEFSRRGWL